VLALNETCDSGKKWRNARLYKFVSEGGNGYSNSTVRIILSSQKAVPSELETAREKRQQLSKGNISFMGTNVQSSHCL